MDSVQNEQSAEQIVRSQAKDEAYHVHLECLEASMMGQRAVDRMNQYITGSGLLPCRLSADIMAAQQAVNLLRALALKFQQESLPTE